MAHSAAKKNQTPPAPSESPISPGALFFLLPEPMVIIAGDWRIRHANDAAAQLFGSSPDALQGRQLWEFWPPEKRQDVARQHVRSFLEQRPVDMDQSTGEGVAERWLRVRVLNSEYGKTVLYRDITEQQHLSELQSRLVAIVESADDAIISKGLDGTILSWNGGAERIFGYKAEEIIGKNIAILAPEGHAGEISKLLQRISEGERIEHFETRRRRKDGEVITVSLTISPIRDASGKVIAASKVARDISDRKRLSEPQQRFASIVESSDDAVLSKDLDGIIRSWNRGAEKLFGYKTDEVVGKHISVLAPPDVADEIPKILDRVRRGEVVDHYETKRRTKDGRILTLTVSPIRDTNGTVIGASKVARDITESKRLSEVQARLASIVESSDDAIISKDLQGYITSWNRGAEKLFGYTAEEIVGKHISNLAPPDVVDEIPGILARLSRGEYVDHYQTKRKTKDGRILIVSLTVSPIRNAAGKIIGASKVARDITDRENHEKVLRAANAALMKSNEDLQQFAYSASHDLQEPLRVVSLYGELLKKKFSGKLGATGEEYLDFVIVGSQRMGQLLRDLRAYTQASTDEQEPACNINSDKSLDKTLHNLAALIMETGTQIDRAPLPQVCIQEFQLELVFQNLITNAVRYRSRDAPKIRIYGRGRRCVLEVCGER